MRSDMPSTSSRSGENPGSGVIGRTFRDGALGSMTITSRDWRLTADAFLDETSEVGQAATHHSEIVGRAEFSDWCLWPNHTLQPTAPSLGGLSHRLVARPLSSRWLLVGAREELRVQPLFRRSRFDLAGITVTGLWLSFCR